MPNQYIEVWAYIYIYIYIYIQLGREFSVDINEMVMPVKYEGILIIIFGIYNRCEQ